MALGVVVFVKHQVLVLDVNECAEVAGTCQHGRCDNLFGSFSCTCHRGYRLSPNRDTCTGQTRSHVDWRK